LKLIMLGTGSAMVKNCYNTCFTLEDNGEIFLVDGGGGNTILSQLDKAGIDWRDIKDIFVTHKHIDHVLGIIWMIRMITQNMSRGKYEGEANIYAHKELCELLIDLATKLLNKKEVDYIGDRLHIIPVDDGETRLINGREVTFFDIGSTKAKQFGFTMQMDDGKVTCLGDEPYSECEEKYARDSKWLLSEAFCLYGQADIFKPYEKHHSTVKEACELATSLGVKNLILYHTEDKTIANRKRLYSKEGHQYFTGNLLVPDDLEVINL